MRWNWQKPDRPHFRWDAGRIAAAEEQFLRGAGTVVGAVKHLTDDERSKLVVEAMSHEAITTSKIEGEILDRPASSHPSSASWGWLRTSAGLRRPKKALRR